VANDIPNEILEASRREGVKSPLVANWLRAQLEGAGVGPEVSPADWPEAIWQAYRQLREAHEPGSCGGSAARLFEDLDLCDGK